ncbi:hypothetical protein SteCoe_21791 [Stentor coeruleus]|uniref:SHSP domain-containing protein n=1 Tax=Stentor coeruleus TaxID=5963 RepID=A0A1R2BNR2_9CILI|nr:hypothetical protein SteCoe_21791 [Stentor coeruleus]
MDPKHLFIETDDGKSTESLQKELTQIKLEILNSEQGQQCLQVYAQKLQAEHRELKKVLAETNGLLNSKFSSEITNLDEENSDSGKYDCVIDIKSFKDLAGGGWELDFPNPNLIINENYEDCFESIGNSLAFLTVTGAYDKGKTFLLNKLCNANFPSSKKVETKGISFKSTYVSDTTDIIIIDTAGTHGPIKYNEKISEKKETEKRIRDLVFLLSDFFIFVVNDFTTLDQELLEKLEKQLKGNKKKIHKELIVVHNLKDVYTEQMAEKAWEKQVTNLYDMKNKAHVITTTVDGRAQIKWLKTEFTRHVMLISDLLPFGKQVNIDTIGLLRQWVTAFCANHTQKNIFRELFKILNENLKEKQNPGIVRSDSIKEIHVAQDQLLDSNKLSVIKRENKYYLHSPYFKENHLDTTPNSFEPAFDIVRSPEEYLIIIDTPGIAEENLIVRRTKNVLIVEGVREKDFDGESQEFMRSFGKFYLEFKIPSDYDYRSRKKVYKDGTLRISFKHDVDD